MMVLSFSIQKHIHTKAQRIKFDLAIKRSTQCHHLSKLGSTRALNAAYQVSRSLAFCSREDFLRFLPYMSMVAILVR